MAIPGVVEMFDESLTAAEYYLQPAFPTLRLDFVPQNVSPTKTAAPPDLAALWGPSLYDQLARMNQLDLELVRRARDEVVRRFEAMPRAERRLAEFKARCSSRAGQPLVA